MVDAYVPDREGQERIMAYGSSLGIDPSDERLGEIFASSEGNLWEAFDNWNLWSKAPNGVIRLVAK